MFLDHLGASSQQGSNQSVRRMGDITDTLLQYCKDYNTDPKRTQPDCSWLQDIARSHDHLLVHLMLSFAALVAIPRYAWMCCFCINQHRMGTDGSAHFQIEKDIDGHPSISRRVHQPEMLFYSRTRAMTQYWHKNVHENGYSSYI